MKPTPIRSLSLLVALALLLCALPLALYFSLNSLAFARRIQTQVDREVRPGLFTFDHLEWGPHPGEVTAFDVVMVHRTGVELLRASRVHAKVELRAFHAAKYALTLILTEVSVDNFDLTLDWDRFGDLGIAQVFKQKTFGIARKKSPEFQLELAFEDIRLNNGNLHLVWPGFGFDFSHINTGGLVRVDKTNGLSINVGALKSLQGTAWIRHAPAALAQGLARALPRNPASQIAPEGLRIPFQRVDIQDYRWVEDGFQGGLDLTLTNGAPLHADIAMRFPSHEPTDNDIHLTLALSGPLTAALTGGAAQGSSALDLHWQGRDLAILFELGPVHLKTLHLDLPRVGPMTLQDLSLSRLRFDARTTPATLELHANAAEAQFADTTLSGLSLQAHLDFGHDGFDANAFAAALSPLPSSALGWLALFPVTTRARLSIPQLSAQHLQHGALKLDGLRLQNLTIAATMPPQVAAHVDALTTSAGARISGDATLNLQLGFGAAHLNLQSQLTLIDTPAALLRLARLPQSLFPRPLAPRVSGRLALNGDLLAPSGLTPAFAPQQAPPE